MFTKCDICHKGIQENEPHHTFNAHIERGTKGMVRVDHAETFLTTCINCGRKVNKEAVRKVLSTASPEKARLLGELFIPMEVN